MDFGRKEQDARAILRLIREMHLNARGQLGGGTLPRSDLASVTIDIAAGTIPPSILLSMRADATLPAGATLSSRIQFSTQALPFSFGTVPGVDVAENLSIFTTSVPVASSSRALG